MKFFSQLEVMALLIFVMIVIPTISLAQDLPAVPNVITQTNFEFEGKTYALEVASGKGIKVRVGGLYCANLNETPELDCDNCSLVLKVGQKELSRILLGPSSFVYDKGKWHVTGIPPLNILKRSGEFPLITFSQYAGCNGNAYYFYWIETQKDLLTLKPVKFVGFEKGLKENELYATVNFEDAVRLIKTSRPYKNELWVSGYSNSDIGSFLVQFGEWSPGQWNCIGFTPMSAGPMRKWKKDS